nr:hypothetical protein CFP56_28161 [Quercus suber]
MWTYAEPAEVIAEVKAIVLEILLAVGVPARRFHSTKGKLLRLKVNRSEKPPLMNSAISLSPLIQFPNLSIMHKIQFLLIRTKAAVWRSEGPNIPKVLLSRRSEGPGIAKVLLSRRSEGLDIAKVLLLLDG